MKLEVGEDCPPRASTITFVAWAARSSQTSSAYLDLLRCWLVRASLASLAARRALQSGTKDTVLRPLSQAIKATAPGARTPIPGRQDVRWGTAGMGRGAEYLQVGLMFLPLGVREVTPGT